MSDKVNYDYQTIHNMIKKGSTDVLNSSFKPDLILAIGGGGFIPARILRTYVNVPIVTLTINFYDQDNKIQDKPNIIQMIDKEILKDKNVLIVDEVDDTRKTLGFLLNYFKNNQFEIKTTGIFVINNKIKNKEFELPNNIHYFACETSNDVWINYPWESP
jgi:uncharacterized protein